MLYSQKQKDKFDELVCISEGTLHEVAVALHNWGWSKIEITSFAFWFHSINRGRGEIEMERIDLEMRERRVLQDDCGRGWLNEALASLCARGWTGGEQAAAENWLIKMHLSNREIVEQHKQIRKAK